MWYILQVWLGVLILAAPVAIFALAWSKTARGYYRVNRVSGRQRMLYLSGLGLTSVASIAYICYWVSWACSLYQVSTPVWVLIVLEQCMGAALAISVASLVCVIAGRGPWRPAVILGIIWVVLQLTIHGQVLHWA